MEQNTWFSCLPCSQEYFSTFDLCLECFEGSGRSNHEHDEDCFEETCKCKVQHDVRLKLELTSLQAMEIIKEMEAQEAAEKARKKAEARAARKGGLTNVCHYGGYFLFFSCMTYFRCCNQEMQHVPKTRSQKRTILLLL